MTELLRVGLQAGALIAGGHDMQIGVFVWAAAAALAGLVALGAHCQRRARLAASELPQAMEHLTQIQARLKLWGGSSSDQVMKLDVSEQGAAMQLLNLESGLPFERLKPQFMKERRLPWKEELLGAKDFSVVLTKLQELKDAIHEPCTRLLLKQVLQRVPVAGRSLPFPAPLLDMMVAYTIPPLTVATVKTTEGWQYGRLELTDLRNQAKREADQLQKRLTQHDLRSSWPYKGGSSPAKSRGSSGGQASAVTIGRPQRQSIDDFGMRDVGTDGSYTVQI